MAKYQPEVHLTPGNNVILANLDAAQRDEITRLLAEHGVQTELERQGSILRRARWPACRCPPAAWRWRNRSDSCPA